MIRVKICGITSAHDARMVAEHGAHAIGLVFHDPSPRCVDLASARRIVAALPPWVGRVGVFVDAAPERIHKAVDEVGLSAVQLHGSESPEEVRGLDLSIPVIKAIPVREDLRQQLRIWRDHWILLDTAGPGGPGGTGQTWDWERFDAAMRPGYLILAGGLTPENVGAAIDRISPEAVDVSSGVERAPGRKDEARVRAFMAAVRPFHQTNRGGD